MEHILDKDVERVLFSEEEMKNRVAEIAAEIEAKKLERKAKKQVTVVENGKETTRSVNEAELNRLRLEMARKQDEEKYKDERTVPLSQLNKEE